MAALISSKSLAGAPTLSIGVSVLSAVAISVGSASYSSNDLALDHFNEAAVKSLVTHLLMNIRLAVESHTWHITLFCVLAKVELGIERILFATSTGELRAQQRYLDGDT